jgi:hypothetical protein
MYFYYYGSASHRVSLLLDSLTRSLALSLYRAVLYVCIVSRKCIQLPSGTWRSFSQKGRTRERERVAAQRRRGGISLSRSHFILFIWMDHSCIYKITFFGSGNIHTHTHTKRVATRGILTFSIFFFGTAGTSKHKE